MAYIINMGFKKTLQLDKTMIRFIPYTKLLTGDLFKCFEENKLYVLKIIISQPVQ